MNTRELILEMLLEITSGKAYSHVVMRNVLDKYDYLRQEEKAFIKRVCEGTLERQIQIDFVLNQFSRVKVNKMKPVIRNILRMSVYQILFMDSVPDSAACNEAVKLAERKKFHQLKGFVNGVLRTIVRERERIPYPDKSDLVRYDSIQYSMPEWIVKMWLKEYGAEVTEKMLQGLLAEHPVTVRIDETLDADRVKELLHSMQGMGIVVKQHPYLSYAYELSNLEGAKQIPGFREGLVNVQDVSSMLVSEAAGIQKNQVIYDVCAAPGGKSMHAACKMQGTGRVESRDLTEYKVSLIEEQIERMGYLNVQTEVWDATVLQESKVAKADVVYADLPCSGLGVMGKKRDIKYRISEEALKSLPKLQKEILGVVQSYVKPGGVLLYSTCTIHKEENEEMTAWFTSHFGFTLESLEGYLPAQLQGDTMKKGYLQLLPGIHETDGFFLARFRKTEGVEAV